MSILLGLDIGTTSTIGILIDTSGDVLALASRPVRLRSPQPGWSEEDPDEWWANVCDLVPELMAKAGVESGRIAGLCVTGMLPALVLLDREGRVLRPSIQQSDGRCGAEVAALRQKLDPMAFLLRTGNGINQQLIAPKLQWIARHEPDVHARIATVMGSYDYINFRLTGERAVEQNWALEAGFTDLESHGIADDLVALAGIPRAVVPQRTVSHAVMGRVSAEAAKATGLPEGLPVAGGAADMIASALGAGVSQAGTVLLKFGGSIDILTATDRLLPDPRLYLDYHLVPGLFMPNGCMSTGGSALNWFAANFAGGHAAQAASEGCSLHQWLDRLAADRAPGCEGLTILPYFLGEKTPLHDPDARGLFEGLTLSHDIGHLWRALLEAYAFAIRHHVEVLGEIGHDPRRFVVSDGGSQSDVWMQIVADVLGAPLAQLSGHPGSCLGAAWVAGIATGVVDDWAGAARFTSDAGTVHPNPANAATYDAGYHKFRTLYSQVYGSARS
jgi:xylulokinase